MASISMVFAQYFCRAILGSESITTWISKPIALLGLTLITIVNCEWKSLEQLLPPKLVWFFYLQLLTSMHAKCPRQLRYRN